MSMRIKRVVNIFSIPLESSVFESHSANIAAQSQLEDFLTGCAVFGIVSNVDIKGNNVLPSFYVAMQ